ncbi:uncharacterized protein LOC106672332 [Cimex lectularius]|uniref:Reverse transcriptase domain-containing protein n=1 Tax=Cimex lectularius TaxID=79782 RepID=A0A8I6S9R3_CIMLE|nr:uncharacterized protein LOC106672332 [Cimex lectularius]
MIPAVNSAPYVIPHHVVSKESSSTTKIRVVFNGSQVDSTGLSLNSRLLCGTKLQKDLPEILATFRLYPIALCADIQKMYRQIEVRPEDRNFQHIFWRPSVESELREYELKTVTYGLAPSAFLAIRVLHQLVQDEGQPYPHASRAILQETYVDDIISGADDLEAALKFDMTCKVCCALGVLSFGSGLVIFPKH